MLPFQSSFWTDPRPSVPSKLDTAEQALKVECFSPALGTEGQCQRSPRTSLALPTRARAVPGTRGKPSCSPQQLLQPRAAGRWRCEAAASSHRAAPPRLAFGTPLPSCLICVSAAPCCGLSRPALARSSSPSLQSSSCATPSGRAGGGAKLPAASPETCRSAGSV